MKHYFLSPSVHWCVFNDRCIVLDINSDRYLQMPTEQLHSVLPFVSRDTRCAFEFGANEMPAELCEVADELLAAHVLTTIRPRTARIQAPSLPKPTALLSVTTRDRPPKGLLRMLPHFLLSCATADYYLRHTSLRRMCTRVSQRRQIRAQRDRTGSIEQGIAFTRIFNALRPLYPRNYLCLFDSLALVEFLALRNSFPNWVFGVTIDPFKAHCWVQDGPIVLSDTVSFSSRWFSPILVL